MNSYEVLVIFKPILDIENVDATLAQFQKTAIEANGGEIAETDRIGRKRLAYEIRKFKDGFLTLFLLKFPPEKVVDFRRACQINDDVLRMTMMRQDEMGSRDNFREDFSARREDNRGPRRDGGRRDFGNRDNRGGDRPDRGPRRDAPQPAASAE